MTTKIAPWLEGLSDAWEPPAKTAAPDNVSSASHDADSLRSSWSRIPRRSLSGLPASLSRQNSSSQPSTQKRRNPLAALSRNEANTLRKQNGSVKLTGTRSVSENSDGSLLACGTVQQRSKSASPSKKQETLEWKRRLVNGQLGYGDQTDLFGPSGLENIFAKGPENEAPQPKKRMSWLPKSAAMMRSSPPPWSPPVNNQPQPLLEQEDQLLDPATEEQQPESGLEESEDDPGSFRSNPFDLRYSDESQEDSRGDGVSELQYRSSPDKAFIEPSGEEDRRNRTASGQTELEQEDFSPVFISKHHTITGQVDYAALDSHTIKQFQNRKVDLRHPSQEQSEEPDSVVESQENLSAEHSGFTDGPESQSLPAIPDISFSENLPTGSPFPDLGDNIEVKRGGYSRIGSFKQRLLSPSQSALTKSINADTSAISSLHPSDRVRLPPAPTPPNAPSTPVQPREPQSRSSGSPLKLFGDHDTFTNNRLLRRLSQLNPDGTLRFAAVHEQRDDIQQTRQVSAGSSFGNGELDEHAFDAEITVTSASDSDKDDSDRSPGSEIPVPGGHSPQGFRFEPSPEVVDTFKMKRKLSKHSVVTSKASTLESQFKSTASLQPTVEDVSESQVEARIYTEGKRPPTSPFKNPTPKRRRTFHASELQDGAASMNQSYHSQLHEAVSSRKRKDARQGESQNIADPEVLSQRKILRPRNPTPSQHRRRQIEAELKQAAEDFAEQEPEKLEAVMEQIESSMASDTPPTLQQRAQTLASEVAAFTLKVNRPSSEIEERKRSVTTQDFLDEAMMVMNLIRAKARPQSNLGSVEESDAEAFTQSVRPDGSQRDESLLRVSRPPSREGSGWRQRAPVSADARVISHLRKFEEREERDDTDFIANSIASLQVIDDANVNDQVVVVDVDANIRITGPLSDKEKAESDSRPTSQRSQGSTLGTQNSNGTSTGQTIGTSSTRKSDNVGTLAPDAVAHLIGEQVGGMTFDKDKQRWVRVSKSPDKTHGSFLELPSNVTSDDDPFREISDLPVDAQIEHRRISSPGKPTQGEAHQAVVESRTSSSETVIAPRPTTSDSSRILHNHSSSIPSRYTVLASSQQEKVETRATSWNDEELARLSTLGKAREQPLAYAAAEAVLAQRAISHKDEDISEIHFPLPPAAELSKHTSPADHAQPTSDEPDNDFADEVSGLRDDTALDLADDDVEFISSPKLRQTPPRPPIPPPSAYRSTNRQVSLRRKTLTSRFGAGAHEQSELSFVAPLPGDRMMSVSLSVSRPLSARQAAHHVTELQSSPSKGSSSFMLSDLPDFTVHEEDEDRPSEKALATRLAQHAAAEVNDRYALAVKELVKILTDAHETEPYWEDLKQLDLHSRSLASLYGLDDFCTRIQDMDVSSNELTHLGGAPVTVRRLNVRANYLSSLTSWNHLTNLQYLNISHNHLEDLNGLDALIHLRELRADDNDITNIGGLFELDGLLKLTLRRNKLQHIDFEGSQLQRLVELDLCGNQISDVAHLDTLPSLAELKLDGNCMRDGLLAEHDIPTLTSLSMRDCCIEELDVSPFRKLKHLNVDNNCLSSIGGLSELKDLDTFSMRMQTLPDDQSISIFDSALEARSILLSGNTIPSLQLSTSFMNVKHLELASVGLQELPDHFGLCMPNLRELNLNHNNLKDVRPLLNIHKLEHLSICGNRLKRLRKSVATFAKLTSLRSLDLRDNPLTQGFYASVASKISRNTSIVRQDVESDPEDEDLQVAEIQKSLYQYPSASREDDRQHRGRLDEDTELRRRVYELLLVNSCRTLQSLDGLDFDRMSAVEKDGVWDRLVELGIITKSQSNEAVL